MIKNKEAYASPICELLVIRFEQNIMSGYGADNQPGKGWGGDGDDDIIDGGSF